MAVVLWIILAISVILFIVSAVLGAKIWRAPTLLTVIGLFLAGLAFIVLAACVLQSHKHWREVARTLEGDIKKERDRRAQLVSGVWGDQEDLTSQEGGAPVDTAPPADAPVDATETPSTDAQPTDQPTDAEAKQPDEKVDEAAKETPATKEEAPKEPENKEEPKTEPPAEEKAPEEKAPVEKAPEEKSTEAKPQESAEKLSAPARFAFTLAPQDEEPKDEEPKDEEPKDEEPKDEEPKDEEPKDDAAQPKAEEPKSAEPKPEDTAEKKEADGSENKDAEVKPDAEVTDQPKEDMPKDPAADAQTPDDAAAPDAAATSDVPSDTTPAAPGPALRRMGIEQLKQHVRQLREDRGRIWEGQGKFAANGATVNVTLPDPHNLSPNTILYTFEKKDQGLFLSEFKVTQVADKTITLESTVILTDDEKKRFAGRDGDWILSDKPPVDSHEALAGLSREELTKLLPAKSADYFANPDAQHAALIAEFENDGKTAQEAGVKSGDAADPRSKRVFARVEVLEEFDVPKPADAKAPPVQEGTELPRAQPGRTMILDREEAANLAKQNKVKVIEEIYVRPLRRYELYWHAAHDRRLDLEDRIKQLAGQTAAMKAADAAAQEVKKQREKEKTELESDQKKLAADRDIVKKHLAELVQAEQALQTAIKEAFVKNRGLAADLTRTQVEKSQKSNFKPAAKSGAAR